MPAVSRYARPRSSLVLLLALSALTLHPAQADDTTPPTVTNAQITPTGTYTAGATLPTLTITATVTDESGGSGVDPNFVFAYILLNGDNFRAASLTKGSGNTYTGTFDLSPYGPNTNPANNVYTAQIGASDLAGNVASFVTATGSVTQTIDTTAPTITNATATPGIVASGGATVTLKVSVADNGALNSGVGPSGVQADVFRDGVSSASVPLASSDGVLYSGTFAIPAGDAAPHLWTFTFTAQDNAGNIATVSRYVQQAGTNSLPAPTLTGLSPAESFSGASVSLTLTGTNFTSSSVVLFDGSVVPATFVSAASLTCAVDGSFLPTAKQVTVQVYNPKPAGGTSASKTFTIKPRLSALSLAPTAVTGGQGSTATVTLAASAFAAQTVALTSSNTAAATVPATVIVPAGASTATFPVSTSPVTTAAPVILKATLGPDAVTGTLTVNTGSAAPTISSLSPASVTAGGPAFTLTVNGTNFISGSIVKWNGATQTTTFVSPTRLTATIPASLVTTAGTASITVTTPHVGTSTGATFTINAATTSAPVLSSISPTTRTAGGGQFVLTANGSNFISGSIVKWNGASQTTTFVSSTKLTAPIPASLTASAGTASVTITTPHVGTSATQTLTINP